MQKKIFRGFIFAFLLFLTVTISSSASAGMFPNIYNINLPKNNVNYSTDSSTFIVNKEISLPSIDVQSVGLTINGLNLTASLTLGSAPIQNNTVSYQYRADFSFNPSNTVTFEFNKTRGLPITNCTYFIRYLDYGMQGPITITDLSAAVYKYITGNLSLTISGNSIYWNINLDKLNKTLPVDTVFGGTPSTEKYYNGFENDITFSGFASNRYILGGAIITVSDTFTTHYPFKSSSVFTILFVAFLILVPVITVILGYLNYKRKSKMAM